MRPPAGSLGARLRKYFISGLLVLIPIFLTVWIVEQLFRLLSGVLARPIASLTEGSGFLQQPIPLLGWTGIRVEHLVPLFSLVALIVLIIATGVVARNFIGSRIVAVGQGLLSRIPIISRIYLAMLQISQALLSDRQEAFRRAVLLEYPRKGIWSVAFVTADSEGALDRGATVEPHYHVFLPTTPNPTSGFFLIVPKSQCVDLEMPVDEALKLVISGGSVTPEGLRPAGGPAGWPGGTGEDVDSAAREATGPEPTTGS